ncbi:hypothetical protein LSTR_LSTR006640 [Laodelphax striatellus]|uniref:Uncharacterized protein n=1 Tax=Laodelphax striatellus TaxID=195883 RepID=A0A482X8L3_LAOST|nr:hypothetical protein LSTR_LSTR006640 [Laodelphax striatellus]
MILLAINFNSSVECWLLQSRAAAMIPVLQKLSGLYVWYVLVVLTLGYLTAELGHFLIGVTSKATATDIHYGDIACQWLPPPHTEYEEELSDAQRFIFFQFSILKY